MRKYGDDNRFSQTAVYPISKSFLLRVRTVVPNLF